MCIKLIGGLLAVTLLSCNPLGWDDSETVTVLLRIQGTVTSSVDNAPIPGTMVTLDASSSFAVAPLAWVETDEAGQYQIERELTYCTQGCFLGGGCPSLHLNIFKAGYANVQTTPPPKLTCTGSLQVRDFKMKPEISTGLVGRPKASSDA